MSSRVEEPIQPIDSSSRDFITRYHESRDWHFTLSLEETGECYLEEKQLRDYYLPTLISSKSGLSYVLVQLDVDRQCYRGYLRFANVKSSSAVRKYLHPGMLLEEKSSNLAELTTSYMKQPYLKHGTLEPNFGMDSSPSCHEATVMSGCLASTASSKDRASTEQIVPRRTTLPMETDSGALPSHIAWFWGGIPGDSNKVLTSILHAGRGAYLKKYGEQWTGYHGQKTVVIELDADASFGGHPSGDWQAEWTANQLVRLFSQRPYWLDVGDGYRAFNSTRIIVLASSSASQLREAAASGLLRLINDELEFPLVCSCNHCISYRRLAFQLKNEARSASSS